MDYLRSEYSCRWKRNRPCKQENDDNTNVYKLHYTKWNVNKPNNMPINILSDISSNKPYRRKISNSNNCKN